MTDPLSRESYVLSVTASLIRCFAEWSKIPPEEWAEGVYRLPNGGRFRWSFAPYSLGMFRSIFDPANIETDFQLYSRGLKSTVVLLALGYVIDQSPRRILSLWPTNSQAEKFSKDILDGELFSTTPALHFLSNQSGRRIGTNTLLHKSFPGGLIDMFGANAPGDMRRAKGSFLYADEIDAIKGESTDEGDQLAIFTKRGSEYPDTIQVFASYPSLKGHSRIQDRLDSSDCNEWYSTCLRCGGEPYVMHRSMVRYEDGKPETATMECPRCGARLTDSERYEMAHKQGFDCWRPQREFRGKRGFHANAMLWPHPIDRTKYPGGFLQMIAQQEIDASRADDVARATRVLVNTVDAEPFEPATEDEAPPMIQPLMDSREDYATEERIIVPKEALVVTCFVDLQLNRFEVFWHAWTPTEESYLLDWVRIPGDVRNQDSWRELTKELHREFQHESGCKIGLSFGFVDGGHFGDWLFAWLRTNPVPGKVRASKGIGAHPHPIVDLRYKSVDKHLKGHHLGTWQAKDLIYSRLRRGPEDPTMSRGRMHFGMNVGEEYFQQLTSEKCTVTFDGGDEIRKFDNDENLRNEALDGAVGNLAAFRLRRWNFDAIREELKPVEKAKPAATVKPRRPMAGAGWMSR